MSVQQKTYKRYTFNTSIIGACRFDAVLWVEYCSKHDHRVVVRELHALSGKSTGEDNGNPVAKGTSGRTISAQKGKQIAPRAEVSKNMYQ